MEEESDNTSDLEICRNCKHFFVTSLFKNWGGGSGYCLLIQNDKNNQLFTSSGTPRANPKAIVRDDDWCEKFERKISLK